MLTIGVISASAASALHMIAVAENMLGKKTYIYKPYIYKNLEELKNIFKQHCVHISGWLFTGPNPYYVVKKYLKPDYNAVCSTISGNEIYKYLLEYLYQNMGNSLRISIDCPIQDFQIFREALEQLSIPHKDLFLQQYALDDNISKIVKNHQQLWDSHKIDIVFTTLHAVHVEMNKLAIPCTRIEVGINSWRQAIMLLEEKLTGFHFRESQLGIICIKIRNYDNFVSDLGNYYKVQKIELLLKSNIIDLCQKIDGYLVEKGNGFYEIFTSRGSIERYNEEIKSFVDEVCITHRIHILCGIGLAATVFDAQLNAHKALANECISDKNSICIIDEGNIIEHFATKNELHYAVETDRPFLTEKLKEAGVSIQTYNRIIFIMEKMAITTFSAMQLAQHLNVTIRNIQRILTGLKKAGLIIEVGQETLNKRGRPTKIYRFVECKNL
ncbi:hypothetical protein [Pectinatus cerevisiiphilus]|uniref:Transcriptional regulator n=1 Tax=Pectinatus cerevisiiphilus TaxID=86956 RepID=A0A4R3K7X6_9FIRM|nr:hypothetical protein [Pectinatus cerevisiiphilus]TCS78977.1 hypothetical protein EDC37_10836 [Pectinatus cerevisiiphilus]